jgi:hypothetical protein
MVRKGFKPEQISRSSATTAPTETTRIIFYRDEPCRRAAFGGKGPKDNLRPGVNRAR